MSTSAWDSFSAACGLTGPLELLVSSANQSPQRHTFARPWVLIGRADQAALRLDDLAVSRRHACLQVLGNRLFAIDLESRTGIHLGGERRPTGWLDRDQQLTVGPFQLQRAPGSFPDSPVQFPDNRSTSEIAAGDPLANPAGTEGLSLASFDICLGAKQVARWRMKQPLALAGRSSCCRIRLRHPSIFRFHCSLVATPSGIWVVDLTPGLTRLRGEPVECAHLEEGDTLQIAHYSLRINYHRKLVPRPPTPADISSPKVEARNLPAAQAFPLGNQESMLVPLLQQFNSAQQQMFDQFNQTLMMVVQMLASMHQEQASLVRDELRQFQKATEELRRLQEQVQKSRAPLEPFGRVPGGGGNPSSPTPIPFRELPPLHAQGSPSQSGSQTAGEGVDVQGWLNQRIAALETERQSSWSRLLGFLRGN